MKDEIKEGYQIIFFLNCRWVGFKSPKLVQWKPNAMFIWNILSLDWIFEFVGGLQYLRSLKWEQKKKRANVARIVTKYVWPPQPNLKCQSLENLQCTFFFGLNIFVLKILFVFRMFLSGSGSHMVQILILPWERKVGQEERANVARIVTKYVWPPSTQPPMHLLFWHQYLRFDNLVCV